MTSWEMKYRRTLKRSVSNLVASLCVTVSFDLQTIGVTVCRCIRIQFPESTLYSKTFSLPHSVSKNGYRRGYGNVVVTIV